MNDYRTQDVHSVPSHKLFNMAWKKSLKYMQQTCSTCQQQRSRINLA